MDMEPCTARSLGTGTTASLQRARPSWSTTWAAGKLRSSTGRHRTRAAVSSCRQWAAVWGSPAWSRETGPDRTAAWTQSRVLELNTMPGRVPWREPTTIGFAEGLGIIFLKTDDGVFAIDLKSGRIKQMSSRRSIYCVIPYMGFYTPDHAMGCQHHENAGIHPSRDEHSVAGLWQTLFPVE
nr:hypothetical protein SEVIR_9G195750v2 [Setaria viridis]